MEQAGWLLLAAAGCWLDTPAGLGGKFQQGSGSGGETGRDLLCGRQRGGGIREEKAQAGEGGEAGRLAAGCWLLAAVWMDGWTDGLGLGKPS